MANGGMRDGAVWDVPTLSLPSHGALGWDGQCDAGMRAGTVYSVPSFPWYIRMGWTVGSKHEGWYSLGCSHSVSDILGYMMGWTVDTVSGTEQDIPTLT